MSKIKEPRILFFDIETCLMAGFFFRLGEQAVRHAQQFKGYFARTHIICITYMWAGDKKAKALHWGTSIEDEIEMQKKFDALLEEADIVIGKNSDRFDVKHINANRMFFDLPGNPGWSKYTDDLEKQMRRYFNLPSHALDYISQQLGFGGKNKMDFSDWVDLAQYRFVQMTGVEENLVTQVLFGEDIKAISRNGKAKFKKMVTYGKKDTEDTRDLWNHLKKHFDCKFNQATWKRKHHACKECGGDNIIKNGPRQSGKTLFMQFYCHDCPGYAGRAPISANGKIGKIG